MKIKANGIEIFYEKIGTGKPLIMAHGNGETHSIFNKATQKLSEHFCVYLPDTRGHGSSEATKLYHYSDMAEDIFAFITELNIEKPIFCGFSDGAISGLLCELTHPGSFSKMILSGANLNPSGLKLWCRLIFGALYLFNKDDKIRLMLKEPNIPLSELSSLKLPVYVTAGEFDMVKRKETLSIAKAIDNSCLKIFKGHTHSSYIANSDIIADYINEITKG